MSNKENDKETLLDRLENVFSQSYLRSVDLSLSDQRLQETLSQHLKWLETKGREGKRADLSRADLYKVDLREANLSRANLSEADLREANLWASNFREANLSGANLSAECRVDRDSDGPAMMPFKDKVNLRRADLREADLRGVDLREADLSRADFSRANLSGARFSNFSMTNFHSLYWAGLSGACLLPIRVYLSEPNSGLEAQIDSAVKSLAQAFGFEVEDFPPEVGRWFRHSYLKITRTIKREDIAEQLEKLAQAIELATQQRTQTNLDKTQAEAIAHLLEVLDGISKGMFQIGSILLPDGKVALKQNLTQKEIVLLEQNTVVNPFGER